MKPKLSLDYTCELRLTHHSSGIKANDLFSEDTSRLRSLKPCMDRQWCNVWTIIHESLWFPTFAKAFLFENWCFKIYLWFLCSGASRAQHFTANLPWAQSRCLNFSSWSCLNLNEGYLCYNGRIETNIFKISHCIFIIILWGRLIIPILHMIGASITIVPWLSLPSS